MVTVNQKIRAGKEAVAQFQNLMVKEYPQSYKMSLSELTMMLEQRESQFLLLVGGALIEADLGMRRLREAMERVVEKSKPSDIPRSFSFINGIVEEKTDFDFSLFGDAALGIAESVSSEVKEVSENVGGGVKDALSGIGNTLSFAGKSLTFVYIGLVAVLGLALYSWVKK